ncbi:MAG: hypothetical protein O7I42_08370 [Alphaproteobacteria bacterium]|nr:hypothetical protein [Alphaproteobacteria bacterium]
MIGSIKKFGLPMALFGATLAVSTLAAGPAAAEGELVVRDFVLTNDVVDREPTNEAAAFTTHDEKAFAFARINNTGALDLGLSPRTLRTHRDNLWLLGGELIRALYDDPPLRNRPVEQLLSSASGDDGGPLIYHGTEQQQRSFDSTCRRFHRFLQVTQSPPF